MQVFKKGEVDNDIFVQTAPKLKYVTLQITNIRISGERLCKGTLYVCPLFKIIEWCQYNSSVGRILLT